MTYKPLRDAVYGYVYFTPLEAIIIEHPYFQRLRFIYQNSTAYLTYPSNQLTRFSHSLGVMHVGGHLFLRSIKNCNEKCLPNFVEDMRQVIKTLLFKNNEDEYNSFVNDWIKDYGHLGDFPNTLNLTFKKDTEINNVCFVLGFTWQAIRLACLIHDIGHFPFSHVFELGIELFQKENESLDENPIKIFKEKIKKEGDILLDSSKWGATSLHEYFGLYLVSSLAKNNEQENPALSKALILAKEIFSYNPSDKNQVLASIDKQRIIPCLHSIVSSNIDADRLDYTLRDTISSGLNVGDFDYRRIINNTVIRIEKNDDSSYQYKFYITSKALSSIEQFINLRYLLYQHLIYHHNVSKYDAIYIQIISKILDHGFISKTSSIVAILERYNFINKQIFLPNPNIEVYDDAWFRTMLQEIQSINELEEIDKILKLLLRTALYRESQHTYSFFKSPADLDTAIESYFKVWFSEKEKEIIFTLQGAQLKSVTNWDISTVVRYLSKHLKLDAISQHFLKNVNKDINDKYKDVTFIWKKTVPKLVTSSENILHSEEKKQIVNLSPYIRNISNVEKFTFTYYYGIVGENIKGRKDVIEECEKILFENLIKAIDQCWEVEKDALYKL